MPNALQKNNEMSGGITYGMGNDIGVNLTDISGFSYAWSTRWDLYRELGYPEIKNMDNFASVLIQMQQIEPTDDNNKRTYAVSLFSDWDGAVLQIYG